MKPAWLQLFSLALLACGGRPEAVPSEEPTAPADPPAPADDPLLADFAPACPDLPAAMPADLTVELALYDYERPEALRRYWFYDAATACPPDIKPAWLSLQARICVPASSEDMATLYALLAPLRTLQQRGMPTRPHHGGRGVTAMWGDSRCTADYAGFTEHPPGDNETLTTLLGAVYDVGVRLTK